MLLTSKIKAYKTVKKNNNLVIMARTQSMIVCYTIYQGGIDVTIRRQITSLSPEETGWYYTEFTYVCPCVPQYLRALWEHASFSCEL